MFIAIGSTSSSNGSASRPSHRHMACRSPTSRSRCRRCSKASKPQRLFRNPERTKKWRRRCEPPARISLSQTLLLCGDLVGADHLAPELDLIFEQGTRDLGRLLAGSEFIHTAIGKALLHLGIGERSA